MEIVIISGGRLDIKSAPAVFESIGITKNIQDLESELLEKNDLCVIAVDGGLKYCKECGIVPQYLVGDFDTIEREILEEYICKPKIKVRRYNPKKDLTDTDAAVNLAIDLIQKKGQEENMIYLLGGIGSRMDHTLANIGCLRKTIGLQIPMKIVDDFNCIYGFEHSFVLKYRELIYRENLSLLALEPVKELTIKGMQYVADKISLSVLSSRGVSNYLIEETAEILFETGIILVVESKD